MLEVNSAGRYVGQFVLGLLFTLSAPLAIAQVDMATTIWDSETESGCLTTMTFLSDKEYMVESKDQIVMKAYKFTQYRRTDFFVFFQRTVANNELLSCTGIEAVKEGTRKKFYAKFSEDKTVMSIFAEPDDDALISVEYKKR